MSAHQVERISHDGGLLRFLTCGSVDDGKSTLIGRLLFDTKLLFEDQLAALEDLGYLTHWHTSAGRAPTDAGYRTANVVVRNDLGQYATITVSGVGTRTAELITATPKVRAGGDVLLGGSGFRANTVVTLSWSDGRGPVIAPVTTASDGSFLVVVPTRANTLAGDRVIVAQTIDQMATVDVRITRRPTTAD